VKFLYTKKFKDLFRKLPASVCKKFAKQIELLSQNTHHPSLHLKKVRGHQNIWEARIDYQYRFTFTWENDSIILRVIGSHDDVLNNP
jgi:mRNA-degrading endonuclease RelE of RelBE toxin-antitoxin system